MLEKIAVLVRVVFDARAVEARGGHRVERDANPFHRDRLIPVGRRLLAAEPVATSTAAGGEGAAQDAPIRVGAQMLGGGGGELDVHEVLSPGLTASSVNDAPVRIFTLEPIAIELDQFQLALQLHDVRSLAGCEVDQKIAVCCRSVTAPVDERL